MTILRLATRQSELALYQANQARQLLEQAATDLQVELVPMVAAGDQITTPLADAGGKDLFVTTLRAAMRDNRADAACHSLKDVGRQPEEFTLAAFLPRADARDALVGATLAELAQRDAPVVGTSSPRRSALLANLLPHADIQPLRGNVTTRLARLDRGDFNAIVLACAGLDRLNLTNRITERLEPTACLPAPGQGIIALECPSCASETQALLALVNDADSANLAIAERACAHALDGDCHTPLGAHAQLTATGQVKLTCQLIHAHHVAEGNATGTQPSAVGQEAAAALLTAGGQRILELIRAEQIAP